jgi:hypothetical protein
MSQRLLVGDYAGGAKGGHSPEGAEVMAGANGKTKARTQKMRPPNVS